MLKKLMITTLSIAALAGASLASAASYNFVEWTDGPPSPGNGEQGFTTFTMADDNGGPVSLTATAWHYPRTSAVERAYVYLDGDNAGMGVCSILDGANQCNPSSDDNTSMDSDGTEVLSWTFGGREITEVTLELGAHDHELFDSRVFQYRDGVEGNWTDATTNATGMVTLSLSGLRENIRFRAKNEGDAYEFYIRNADVTSVPIPAAAWLFGSALIGLAGVARKRKMS